MEPSPENDPSADLPDLPKTPAQKQRRYGPPIVTSTPQSNTYGAHAKDEVPQRASVLNRFLEDDVNDRVVLTLNDFATVILDLPSDWEVRENFDLSPESKAVKDAFEAYLKVAEAVPTGQGKRERVLYQPLANLLNTLRNGTGLVDNNMDEKMFYVQDPRPVLGALLARKPDLGGIYTQLLELAENRNLSTYLAQKKIVGVFWGLLLFFVEIKHRNGNFIGLSKGGITSSSSSFGLQSLYREQSGALSSTETSPQSNMPPPASATTSTSSGKEDMAGVTIHQSGGKDMTVEVEMSQLYEQKAEEELKEEENLTPTQGQRRTRIQCASYAKEMLSNGFIRNHAIGITADSDVFRFQYYDRSKVVESEAFRIVDEEWKKLFMAMVCQLNQLSSEKLGFIPNLHLDDFDYLRDPRQFAQDFKTNPEGLVGATYRFKCSDGYTRLFVIRRVLYRAEGIIGRASVVVEVECVCTDSGCQWHGERKVIKISFPSRSRPPEDALIREARSKAQSTGDLWALDHLPQIIDSITITYDESTVQGRLKAHLKEEYEERVMRVTILEKLHPLSELEDPRDFAQVFYDILQIHQWLYECVGILHRDLSSGNIMFRRKDGKIYGVLNDFDLSSRVQNMDKGPTSNHRTGTRPFMSIDLLNPKWEGGHLYRHDIESLFYIMLCLACRYMSPNVPTPEPRAYAAWFSGTNRQVFVDKYAFLSDPLDEAPPIQPYFAGFKRWLRRIHKKLRSGYKRRPAYSSEESSQPGIESDDDESSDSDEDDEDLDFDWNTLNKRASYKTMRSIMSSFQGQSLETRWASWNPEH
ncbi:protein kinase [Lentinula detonsa]|uniref:Protein kinase n=1 Tax=Lentinula detonsa TaxID=2804962 RepID=A0AA38UWJ3_9AGAR|nr:protein kinase [Lentinula detonsa]